MCRSKQRHNSFKRGGSILEQPIDLTKQAFDYIDTCRSLCETMDVDIKQVDAYKQAAEEVEAQKQGKSNLLDKLGVTALFVICALFSFIVLLPVCILKTWLWAAAILPAALLLTALFKFGIKKRVLPLQTAVLEEEKGQITSNIDEYLIDLYVTKAQYEETLKRLPAQLRHELALLVMRQALEHKAASCLREARTFYMSQYNHLVRNRNNEEAQKAMEAIKSGEETVKKRENALLNIEQTVAGILK